MLSGWLYHARYFEGFQRVRHRYRRRQACPRKRKPGFGIVDTVSEFVLNGACARESSRSIVQSGIASTGYHAARPDSMSVNLGRDHRNRGRLAQEQLSLNPQAHLWILALTTAASSTAERELGQVSRRGPPRVGVSTHLIPSASNYLPLVRDRIGADDLKSFQEYSRKM